MSIGHHGQHAEFLRAKRAEIGQREGREQDFVLLDHNMDEVPRDDAEIEKLVKAGKLKAQDLTRVHKADLKEYRHRKRNL